MIARRQERNPGKPATRAEKGFSLLELVVAMAVFLLISGMSFSLFNQQQKSAQLLQGLTALNVALRNSVAELQMDVVGGGSGYFQNVIMPSWPVGVTIVNNMDPNGTSCYNSTTKTYSWKCFDQLTIVAAASQTVYPAIHATDNTGGTSGTANCSNTTNGTAYGQAASVTVNGVTTTWTLANTAAEFKSGDQLLFVTNNGTVNKITTVVLTANATVTNTNTAVKFTFSPTNVDGSNSLPSDPLDITACDGNANCAASNQLASPPSFCGTSWIIKLSPITYLVCAGPGSSNPLNTNNCDQTTNSPDIEDPKLTRVQTVNGVTTKSVVMEQVIGFRVGAALWNGGTASVEQQAGDSVTTSYNYLASTYCVGGTGATCTGGSLLPYNFSLVRSVRVSLIGRTAPSTTNTGFENAFDSGHYQVQGVAVVVNPRNMSMNDN
ncbi:MAG: type II secretion system protein J [Candidatus Korobacteraceae bacterium]